ncbi:MAG: RNA 2',3'-cyclic phosphodiesterase [Synergistaceae bacterium]|jgi:2'-5' RNA ligase|nr:RNA 2',3'-cyclic phosphodiesterase [Synergistaceae bacterium]
MTPFYRTFVAVTPPEEVLDRMAGWAAQLRPLAPYKWVSRAQFHVTLRFLGEAPLAQVDALAESLGALKAAAFEMSLDRFGGFPDLQRPRVLWLGGTTGAKDLADLAAKVEEVAVRSGFPPETKKFNAHLTLARTRDALPLKTLPAVPAFKWRVSRFFLVQSELTPGGPIYTPLREYSLR